MRLPRLLPGLFLFAPPVLFSFLVSGPAPCQQQAPPAQQITPSTPQNTRPGNNSAIPRSNAPRPPAVPPQFNANFAGDWTGTFSSRDASATDPNAPDLNREVNRGVTLHSTATPDGRAVNLLYTYAGGPVDPRVSPAQAGTPGRPGIETERTILAFTADTALITGTRSAQNQMFQISGTAAFARTGLGTLVLTGPGTENDKPVDQRITLTLTPTQFTWLKEIRPAGSTADFTFRNQYTLTRK